MSNEQLVLQYQTSRQESERREILAELYKQNTGIIRKTVTMYAGAEEQEDLMQEAFFGLVTAAERWKADGGANFATYAVYWIRQAVKRYIDDCGNVVRVPVHLQEKVYQYRRLCAEYEATCGHSPLDSEAIRQLDLSPEQFQEVRKADKILRLRSTSEPVIGSDDLTLEDVIADTRNGIEDAEEQIQHEQMAAALWDMVEKLPEREAVCIRERYKAGRTLKETGAVLGVTLEQAYRIEGQALKRMRRGAISKALRPFLEEKAIQYAFQSSGVGAFKNSFTSPVERAVLTTESYLERLMERYERTENIENGEPKVTDCHGRDREQIP